jgi:hypothetical protein
MLLSEPVGTCGIGPDLESLMIHCKHHIRFGVGTPFAGLLHYQPVRVRAAITRRRTALGAPSVEYPSDWSQ